MLFGCKSYLVFTSRVYKIFVFLVVPVFLIIGDILMNYVLGMNLFIFLLMAMGAFEIMADNWFLGAFCSKEAEPMDFLKTSPKGDRVMQNVIVIDLVRRLVQLCLLAFIFYLIDMSASGSEQLAEGINGFQIYIPAIFTSYCVSVFGTLITRFFTSIWLNFIVAYLSYTVETVVFLLIGYLFDFSWVISVVVIIASLVLSVPEVGLAIRKYRGGYYDK